jgi:ribosomal protein S18 acetylase RimI-like enzyme
VGAIDPIHATRRQGLGIRLLRHAERCTRATDVRDWIHLQVPSGNEAALRMYDRAGYRVVGEVQDIFRLDGVSFPYTYMTLHL